MMDQQMRYSPDESRTYNERDSEGMATNFANPRDIPGRLHFPSA